MCIFVVSVKGKLMSFSRKEKYISLEENKYSFKNMIFF